MESPDRQQFRSARVDLELPVELTFSGSSRSFEGRSLNVSETGMLVRTAQLRPPGTAVRFDVERRYGGHGKVAWVRDEEDGSALMGLCLGRSRYALVELLEEQRR